MGYQAKGTPGRHIVDGAQKIRVLGEEVAVQARIFTIGGFSAHAGQSQILDWLGALHGRSNGVGLQVFLVHGEYKAQQILADLIREKYGLRVHIPAYLEELALEPGQAAEIHTAPVQISQPRIDWEYLLAEQEAKIGELRVRIQGVRQRPWVDQVDVRDRLLEIQSDLSSLISEL